VLGFSTVFFAVQSSVSLLVGGEPELVGNCFRVYMIEVFITISSAVNLLAVCVCNGEDRVGSKATFRANGPVRH